MTTPPGTTFDVVMSGVWVSWTVAVGGGAWRACSGVTGRRRSLAVAVLAGSALAGLALLAYTLLRWGYLDPLLGYDGPAYRRGLPFVGVYALGLLVVLDGLRRLESAA